MVDDLLIRRSGGAPEYPRLVRVWRTSVDATHDFLAAEHRDEIEARLATEYLPRLTLSVAVSGDALVGFAGTSGAKLEMLFVDADRRGRGIGSRLVRHVVAGLGVRTVDVNEQNDQAVGFYRRFGFVVTDRSALDDDGRPYPILHMVLDT